MLFQLFAACSCDILILFMICLGGEIIIHSYDLSVDAYQLFWYQYNSSSKFLVWFIIRHTQKAYYFASFKSLNCSLETFTNVWLLFIPLYIFLNSNICLDNTDYIFRSYERLEVFWLCFKAWNRNVIRNKNKTFKIVIERKLFYLIYKHLLCTKKLISIFQQTKWFWLNVSQKWNPM